MEMHSGGYGLTAEQKSNMTEGTLCSALLPFRSLFLALVA